MLKQLKTITLRMVAGANIATIIVMAIIGYSYLVNPVKHPTLSSIGLTFPIFLCVNLAFLFFWVAFHKKWIWIPLAGYLVCLIPVRAYIPLNAPKSIPEGAFKVLSFNVYMFAPWDLEKDQPNPIVEYILNSDASIVCLQEAGYDVNGREAIEKRFAEKYKYRDTIRIDSPASNTLQVLSRFPILEKIPIHYESTGNMSIAYILQIHGEKVLLVNNHLQSNHLGISDRERFRKIVKGDIKSDSLPKESNLLITKLGKAAKIRAPQAEKVSVLIQKYRKLGYPVISCGDFNDSPVSYAHYTMCKGLTDCYISSGIGPGWSYHRSGMYVRIDNIMSSKDFEAYAAKVDRSVTNSDHYPIYCWLKRK
jgi:endonuclease/exonuclease/phosphatase family metal-dependent hydrolase